MNTSNLLERQKIGTFLLYIFLAVVAIFLPLTYVHATSIGNNVTVTGNTTLGDVAASDTLTVTARLAANINPNANTNTAERIWNNTVIADAKLASIERTPERISNPEASAEPTYPGAAGTK